MISLKKYWDQSSPQMDEKIEVEDPGLTAAAVGVLRSALREMGSSTAEACPAVGAELKDGLSKVDVSLSDEVTVERLESANQSVQEHLRDWVARSARHNQQKTDEVKEILIVMARTAESVGERDQRAAGHMAEVTGRLQKIATLEDLTQIRASIEQSATELKTSIARIAAEGKAAIQQLKAELSVYQTRLEEAERIASSDGLTGVRSRLWMEKYISRRIGEDQPFCLILVDIDEFKSVNDLHGHPVGDELLKQFSTELKSAFRTSSVVARWGGDEFIILLDCDHKEAQAQVSRLKKWVCGSYTLQGRSGPVKLSIDASVGLAGYRPKETIKDLLARADTDMYRQKAASRTAEARAAR